MRIAIEAQRIFRKKKHGMDFVVLEMLRELQQIDHENEYYVFVSPGEDRCLESTPHMKVVELHMPSYPLWEQVALPLAVKRCGAELLHCTSNTAPIFSPVPLIVTLHDIIFLEKRHGTTTSWYQKMGWYYRRWNVPRILPSCRKVITVSHFERDNILRATGLAEDKVLTIYNGYSQHFRHHDVLVPEDGMVLPQVERTSHPPLLPEGHHGEPLREGKHPSGHRIGCGQGAYGL